MSRFYDALKEASRAAATAGSETEPPSTMSDLGEVPEPAPFLELEPAPPENPAFIVETSDTGGDSPSAVAPAIKDPRLAVVSPHERNGGGIHSEPAVAVPQPALHLTFDQAAKVLPNAAKSVVVEQYRRLRTKVLQEQEMKPFRSLVITSAGPQEGKTVTALNLALSLAMLPNYKVLLVDGDLRRGALAHYLGVADCAGLSDVIAGTAKLEDIILKFDDIGVHFIVRGKSTLPAAELLCSEELARQLGKMTEAYDLVIVDTPPVTLVTDTQLIASKCDAVLVVARAFTTTRKALEKAMQELSALRVIGAILNSGTRAQVYRRYTGYY